MSDYLNGLLNRWLKIAGRLRGYSPEELQKLETSLGISFCPIYRQFLAFGGKTTYTLFDISPDEAGNLVEIRSDAEALLDGCRAYTNFVLPPNAAILFIHYGYTFAYILCDGNSADSPVYNYLEGDPEPLLIYSSFTQMLEAHVEYHEKRLNIKPPKKPTQEESWMKKIIPGWDQFPRKKS